MNKRISTCMGPVIQNIRDRYGYSVNTLARRIGIKRDTLDNFEKQQSASISTDTFIKIMRTLGYETGEIAMLIQMCAKNKLEPGEKIGLL